MSTLVVWHRILINMGHSKFESYKGQPTLSCYNFFNIEITICMDIRIIFLKLIFSHMVNFFGRGPKIDVIVPFKSETLISPF